jgi:hypothetical protein
MFKNGRIHVNDEDISGWPPVVSDDLVQSIDQKIYERQHFTISELLCEFPQILYTVLCKIITIRLGHHKVCAKLVPKMLTGAHKMQRMALALTFLERHHKDGDEFFSHIVHVTSDEI